MSDAGPRLIIATPVHYSPEMLWVRSMFHALHALPQHGVHVGLVLPNGDSLITRARNTCVASFLESDASHLLFIDADLEFRTRDILGMLKSGHELVGGLYPKKQINWENVRQAAVDGEQNLAAYAADYVCNMPPGDIWCEGGCVPVQELGTGFMLIARTLLERYIAAYPDIAYKSDNDGEKGKPMHAVFDCFIARATFPKPGGGVFEVEESLRDRYLSEDYAFCLRCRAMGVTPYAYLPAKLAHVGQGVYRGDVTKAFVGLADLLRPEAA